ncbi:MAG: HD domain-containing protein, partial [Gemmatimonadales bacterium]
MVEHFEHLLVLLIVVSLLGIHYLLEEKFAFLSFYALPVIFAGFFLGKRPAVLSALLIVVLVLFFQAVEGLTGTAGLHPVALLTLVPWGGFLVLTGYVVGMLSEQAKARLFDLRSAYLATLELLTVHLEATEKQQEGHSRRVSDLAVRLGEALGLRQEELETLRVGSLLHEVGTREPRLLKLLAQPGGSGSGSESGPDLPVARAMRGAGELINEYTHYYEVVGDEWPIDELPLSTAVKILAVADAFETLQIPTLHRPAFAPWSAIEEIERGTGRTFARDVVRSLR